MSKKYLFSSAIILTLVMSIFFPSKSQADWTNSFEKYSDMEGTYSGNFS
ncbi:MULTISPECIES: hypothetical protein [Bacillaceae]|nr:MULTISPECIES: hypothetical protein [Bacillaceae]MDF2067245.1 hypothetical protein [Bacillus sp. Cr_A10]